MGVFEYIPIKEATTPKDGYVCYVNYWWAVKDNCVIGYRYGKRLAPQCNKNPAIVNRLAREEGVEAKFFDVIYWEPDYDF